MTVQVFARAATFPRKRARRPLPTSAAEDCYAVAVTGSYPSEALLSAARDAVLVVDDARRFVDANPAACRLLGLALKDLLGKRFDDFLDEPGLDLDAAWLNFLETGEQMGELRVVRPDGERRPVEYNATARFVAGRHLAILRDIAGRKRAEAERARAATERAGAPARDRDAARRSAGP